MKLSRIFCITAITGSMCLIASADPIPRGIKTQYTALIKAIRTSDFKKFDAYYQSDYVSVDPSGNRMTRAEYVLGAHALMKGSKKTTCKIKFLGAKSRKGFVDITFDFTGKIVKSDGTISFHEVGVDTWRKMGTDWLEVKTVDTKMDVKTQKAKSK